MAEPDNPRIAAAAAVGRMVDAVRALPPAPWIDELIDGCGYLERAIRAFHMEAIRFRAFSVRRILQSPDNQVPADVRGQFEEVTRLLEAAGFHTRSH